MNLGLGTAQFGQRYGISNSGGVPSPSEVRAILSQARDDGCSVLDTAVAYGEAERVLGEIGVREWKVVTKLSLRDLAPGEDVGCGLDRVLAASLRRLRLPALYGLLLHRAEDLASPRAGELVGWLVDVKRRGLAQKIGVSVYRAEELEAMSAFAPDLVQIPSNVFDQRAERSGCVKALKDRGTEVHLRSIFLQGLLLMATAEVARRLPDAAAAIERFRVWCATAKLSPLKAALAYVKGLRSADVALVGVTSLAEWREVSEAFRVVETDRFEFAALALEDDRVLDPRRWSAH